MKKTVFFAAVTLLLFAGCAAPRGYYPEHYRKELTIEIKEKADNGDFQPEIVARFKITN